MHSLRHSNLSFCVLTNDCSVSKAERLGEIERAGVRLKHNELIMVAEITNEWLKRAGVRTITYLGARSVLSEVARDLYVRSDEFVDAVVVGDMFKHYDRHLLDIAVKAISNGARLVAMHRNPLWSDGKEWFIDNGFWVAGLEYVTGQRAVVTGKPSQEAYTTAVAKMGLEKRDLPHIAVVSDNISIDLQGAKEVGLRTVYMGTDPEVPSWIDSVVSSLDELALILAGEQR